MWKCFYLVWYVINPFIILILQSPHTITLMRCLSRHAHLHMSTLRVTWLVITELRSISFRLVLHAQHIYATLQLYPYNDLLHCEHSTCIIQQCIMLWMEFFHCRVWFCALSWCCAHIQCSAMILIPYGSLCAKYFFSFVLSTSNISFQWVMQPVFYKTEANMWFSYFYNSFRMFKSWLGTTV